MKHTIGALTLSLLLFSCGETAVDDTNVDPVNELRSDSIRAAVIEQVEEINQNDSLLVISSLEFSVQEDITYSVKQYIANNVVKMMKIKDYSNDFLKETDIYYHNDYPIFISEYSSTLTENAEVYNEKMVFVHNKSVYNAYEKSVFSEVSVFDDTLFQEVDFQLSSIDFQKPIRALQQKGEFAMHFDEFLVIEPQSYLIVENEDSSINAALLY